MLNAYLDDTNGQVHIHTQFNYYISAINTTITNTDSTINNFHPTTTTNNTNGTTKSRCNTTVSYVYTLTQQHWVLLTSYNNLTAHLIYQPSVTVSPLPSSTTNLQQVSNTALLLRGMHTLEDKITDKNITNITNSNNAEVQSYLNYLHVCNIEQQISLYIYYLNNRVQSSILCSMAQLKDKTLQLYSYWVKEWVYACCKVKYMCV